MLHGVHAFCGDAELYKEAEEKLKEAKIKLKKNPKKQNMKGRKEI